MNAAARMTASAAAFGVLALSAGCQPVAGGASAAQDPMALGLALMRQGQPSQALGAFNRALADEVSAPALTAAASAYHALGQPREAEQLLRAAVERDANFALARNNLGILLYESGDYVAAEQELRRAFALTNGADRAIATNLAFAEFALSQQTPPPPPDAAGYDVIQYGHGLFRLERADEDLS